jgi:hypothetical protein
LVLKTVTHEGLERKGLLARGSVTQIATLEVTFGDLEEISSSFDIPIEEHKLLIFDHLIHVEVCGIKDLIDVAFIDFFDFLVASKIFIHENVKVERD